VTAQANPDPRIRSLPAAEIRRRFVEFFAERGHAIVPSASLVPAGDQTLLFTNSGMVQFKELFTGAETRSYTRAADYQRVLRVAGKHNDFEEVGRTTRHHTFFEMLGNWSFGDYFKREAIHFAWDFLTGDLGIPAERLAATTYKDDEVARSIWRDEIGLAADRMATWGDVDAGDESNFWRMAETGPCGPCSEIHFDRGVQFSEGPECIPDHSESCPRWLELWNLVFMEFEQRPDGRVLLPFQSVDTGLGLERIASVLQQVPSNFDTDLFTPIHARMRELLGHDPDAFEAERFSYQVIADHSRAITFLIADGVLPSNEGRGVPLPGRAAGRDPGCDRARGGPVRADPRCRRGPPRGGPDPADQRRAARWPAARGPAARRAGPRRGDGVPPPRHVRFPDRPDRRARRRIRRGRRPAGLRRGPGRAARAQPRRPEG
jgi:alanyl-tRNA synthetase